MAEQELANQVFMLQNQVTRAKMELSCWTKPDTINNVEQLKLMENSLHESLNQLRLHKENINKQKFEPLEGNNQSQNAMYMPQSWFPGNENQQNQQNQLLDESNTLPRRDTNFTFDPSLPGCSHDFGDTKIEHTNFTFDPSLPGCSHDFWDIKIEPGNANQHDQARPECDGLNKLPANACMGVQIGEPCSFSLFDDINLPESKVMQDCTVNQIAGPQDLPMSMFDTKSQPWAPSELPTFNEYPQDRDYHTERH